MTAKTPAMLVIGLSLSTGLPTFVEACHRQGVAVVVICEPFQRDTPAARQLTELYERRLALADVPVEVAVLDSVRVLSAVQRLANNLELKGVYADSEKHVEVAARVATIYDLPGPGLRAATISRNKVMQRLLCAAHGVAVPPFTVATTADEAYAFLAEHAPVVAKPCSSSGSDGVRRLDCAADLKDYLAEARNAPFLLERYLAGREISVECLVLDGLPMLTNFTGKGKGAEPYFVETVQVVPAELAAGQQTAFAGLAMRIIELTGMETGILHLEAIDCGTVYPVEWAVREPGHAVMDLINWRYGGQATPFLVGMHLRHDLPQVPAPAAERIALTVFIDLPPGTIVRVRQDRDPNTIPGVVDFDFYGSPGDATGYAHDNWSTFGAYSVWAENRTDLVRVLDDLDAAFGVLLRAADGGETWCCVSSQARAEIFGHDASPTP
ncbi:ATP-grasp domain-containing protein [Nonomuraea sp. PA05]|uniref:ATP-grasp domain-containing protein n=1 Tax=Nonomuraea sp. PA05 TaxID=2604466 RepID=UPI001651D15C|nr:ATP-grasp domain-containing protein [Nonomuraea sp. PA05]